MKRKDFIRGVSVLTGAGLLTGLYTWQIEPFWLEFTKVKMPVKNLPVHLHGKTLMQISDIHVGKRFDWQFLIDSFKEAQELQPDFVVYTGDYVSGEDDWIPYPELQKVMHHAVKGLSGTFAILGNHDYGRNWAHGEVADKISGILKDSGLRVLRNEQTEVNGLNLIGLDDLWGRNFQPEKVMDHYNASKANVLLCHNPDVCDLDIWNGYEGWILSGHTHGGQCKPPFLPPPMLPVKNPTYSAGEIPLSGNRTLYINRALGHLWQIRFNVRPEITMFELEIM